VRLDGLPLAIELAAARLKLFTPGELTFRLRHRMKFLTGGARDIPERHRTLRAALTWSHDLLSADERALFRRLSVFVGGWTLEAAEAVCADGDRDVVEAMASLVDKSLVRRTRRGDLAEFTMLESLREFAAERLAEHARRTRRAIGTPVTSPGLVHGRRRRSALRR
jgi:predicted ATPase